MENTKSKFLYCFAIIIMFSVALLVGCSKEEGLALYQNSKNVDIEQNRDIVMDITYKFYCPGDTSKIEFRTLIPQDYSLRQKVKSIDFNLQPDNIYTSGNNKYAFFIFEERKHYFELSIDCRLCIYDYDLLKAQEIISQNAKIEDFENIEMFIKPESFIESGSETIKDIAQRLTGADKRDTVRACYDYVLSNLEYSGYNPDNTGALKALELEGGDCTEYSDLFVALCRASGIPARVVEGYTCEKGDRSIGHNWAEVYFEDVGWVPFDPTYEDSGADTSFHDIENNYIYMSFIRNDPSLLNFHYYSYYYWGDEPEVIKEVFIR